MSQEQITDWENSFKEIEENINELYRQDDKTRVAGRTKATEQRLCRTSVKSRVH